MADNNPNDQSWYLPLGIGGAVGINFIGKKIKLILSNPTNVFRLKIISCFLLSLFITWAWFFLEKIYNKRKQQKSILGKEEGAVYCGKTDENEEVWIKARQRTMHTQVIGTTNAGKTESVILPWAIQDIYNGRGLLLIDGKSDRGLLDKLWAFAVHCGREKDFRLFSFSNIAESHQFNPLIGGTSEEICERVFNSFEFENPHFRSLQFEVMGQILRILAANKIVPTFSRLHQLIMDSNLLLKLATSANDIELLKWASHFASLPLSDREERTSGLQAAFGQFKNGNTSILFNSEKPEIDLDEALSKNQIIYFQLPVLLSPFLGKATGKLVLQALQSAIANRHRTVRDKNFYSVFLDDFAEYLYPGFVSILNKSRSANIGIVFAHQANGDLEALGQPIANTILTNSNLKVIMRGNDPVTAEYFSKVIGTKSTVKFTEREKTHFNLVREKTGDTSAREVEEFMVHPNSIKRNLGVGEGIMIVPHERGSDNYKVKFNRMPDLPALGLPIVEKIQCDLIKDKSQKVEENLGEKILAINSKAA